MRKSEFRKALVMIIFTGITLCNLYAEFNVDGLLGFDDLLLIFLNAFVVCHFLMFLLLIEFTRNFFSHFCQIINTASFADNVLYHAGK